MTAAVADAAHEAAVGAVLAAVEKATKLWPEIDAAVRAAIAAAPILRDVLTAGYRKLSAKFTEVMDLLGRIITERGDPTALRAVGTAWTNQVGRVAAEEAGRVHPGQLPSYGQWSGSAATKYLQVVFDQRQALADIKGITDNLQAVLNETATTIKNFWVILAAETAVWLSVMITCAFTAALGGVAGAIAASVLFVSSVTKQLADFANAMDTTRAKLEKQATLTATFPGGRWPPTVTNTLADASVRDGDKSDWTPAP